MEESYPLVERTNRFLHLKIMKIFPGEKWLRVYRLLVLYCSSHQEMQQIQYKYCL